MSKQSPNINLLVRYHKGRKELFRRALTSLQEQTYKHWCLIISYESDEDYSDLLEVLGGEFLYATLIRVVPQREVGNCFFNLYLNDLKNEMKAGWGLIYDTDSFFFLPESLQKLSEVLTNENEIHIIQFVRMGKQRPSVNQINSKTLRSGHCDSASIVFHVSQGKDIQFTHQENADYIFILQMLNQYPSQWHELRVVETDRRSRGK